MKVFSHTTEHLAAAVESLSLAINAAKTGDSAIEREEVEKMAGELRCVESILNRIYRRKGEAESAMSHDEAAYQVDDEEAAELVERQAEFYERRILA